VEFALSFYRDPALVAFAPHRVRQELSGKGGTQLLDQQLTRGTRAQASSAPPPRPSAP